jgi:hypothetical protein
VVWEECESAQLIVATTPWAFDAPFVAGSAFNSGFCRRVQHGTKHRCNCLISIHPKVFVAIAQSQVFLLPTTHRYEYYLGTDTSWSVGGGTVGLTLRRSTRGFQVLPVINQVIAG